MKGEGEPPPSSMGPNIKILTCNTVGHLSSIVQKAELPTTQGFPGSLVSQLVPRDDKDRKLQTADLGHAPNC